MTKPLPIVLIHGLFGSLNDEAIAKPFRRHETYAPDLLGYGELASLDVSGIALQDQADRIADYMSRSNIGRAHLVGHSIGGAVAVLTAFQYPEIAASVTLVEGNLTIADAFWSKQLVGKSLLEVEEIVEGYRADPGAWISNAGVPISDWTSRLASQWLINQPASTILAQASAVVASTRDSSYLDTVDALLNRPLAVNLVAGSRSATGWDVPKRVNDLCNLRINIRNTGHLMMLEAPAQFAQAVETCIGYPYFG